MAANQTPIPAPDPRPADAQIEDIDELLEETLDEQEIDSRPNTRGDVHRILTESGAVGGADNTAEPAGANYSHGQEHAQQDETAEAETARDRYEGDAEEEEE